MDKTAAKAIKGFICMNIDTLEVPWATKSTIDIGDDTYIVKVEIRMMWLPN